MDFFLIIQSFINVIVPFGVNISNALDSSEYQLVHGNFKVFFKAFLITAPINELKNVSVVFTVMYLELILNNSNFN